MGAGCAAHWHVVGFCRGLGCRVGWVTTAGSFDKAKCLRFRVLVLQQLKRHGLESMLPQTRGVAAAASLLQHVMGCEGFG